MSDEREQAPNLPHYPSTSAIHLATRDQAKPMLKLVGRMVKQLKRPGKSSPRTGHGGKKGLSANQNVAIKHKQIFY